MKKSLFFLFISVMILVLPIVCVGQGFFKPVPKPRIDQSTGLFVEGSDTDKWAWRPTVQLPALKILRAAENTPGTQNPSDAIISAQILTSVGGGVSRQHLIYDKDKDKWVSKFTTSLIVLLAGDFQQNNSELNISPALTFGLFEDLPIILGFGYNLGDTGGRGRLFGCLSVGINFNNK